MAKRKSKADAFRDYFANLIEAASCNGGISNPVVVMSAETALVLSQMRNRLGEPEFGGISVHGGDLFGIPVMTSLAMPPGSVVLMRRDLHG